VASLADLSLAESVLLLVLHDTKGTPHTSTAAYAIAGALIADLMLRGKLVVEDHDGTSMLIVRDMNLTGDAVLDECLSMVRSATAPAAIQTWISRLAGIPELKDSLAERLCHRGVLSRHEDKVLWVFARDTYPATDMTPERDLVAALRFAVMSDGPADRQTAVLVALSNACGILQFAIEKDVLKQRKERLEELTSQDVAGCATRDAIAAVHAAVLAGTMAVAISV
jgi:Golgi phosphoprotein 3